MKWLVSYRYRPMFKYRNSRMSNGSSIDTIGLFDEHPAKVVADTKLRVFELDEKEISDPTPERVDEIEVIYSVVEIPDEVFEALTPEQLEALES